MTKQKMQKTEKEIKNLAGEIKQESETIIKEEKLGEEEKQKNEWGDLKNQLEEQKKLAEERASQLKYMQADFDNYRKKFEKEKENIIALANEGLIKELIVILDDFESSIKLVEDKKNREGIELLQKKFFSILANHGLKKIEALGKKFNPNFHEVLCKELSEQEDGTILDEIQKGYLLCSKVIRASKVKVSEKNKQDLKIAKQSLTHSPLEKGEDLKTEEVKT